MNSPSSTVAAVVVVGVGRDSTEGVGVSNGAKRTEKSGCHGRRGAALDGVILCRDRIIHHTHTLTAGFLAPFPVNTPYT